MSEEEPINLPPIPPPMTHDADGAAFWIVDGVMPVDVMRAFRERALLTHGVHIKYVMPTRHPDGSVKTLISSGIGPIESESYTSVAKMREEAERLRRRMMLDAAAQAYLELSVEWHTELILPGA